MSVVLVAFFANEMGRVPNLFEQCCSGERMHRGETMVITKMIT